MQDALAPSGPSVGKLSRVQRLGLMVGSGILLFFLLNLFGLFDRLELVTYDLRFQLRGERPVDAPIIIVAINDESFQVLDQNLRTWPRAEYARLIDVIASGKPAIIGVDIAWTHTGRDSGGDETLANSLERAGLVILAGLIEHQQGPGYEYNRYAGPVGVLAESASGIGLANVSLDADGVFRRVARHQVHNDTWYPSFGYAIVHALGLELPDIGEGRVTDLLINFRGGPHTFPTVPMYQVLTGEVPPGRFAGQIVLIGFTTVLEQDVHVTPLDPDGLTPGVEVHANAVATLWNDDPIQRASTWLTVALSLALVVGAVSSYSRLNPFQATVAAGGSIFLYLAVATLLFAQQNLWLPVIWPSGLTAFTIAGGLVERVVIEEREKRRLRDRFQSFMAPERLAVVMNRWEELMADDRPEVSATVLFADIRGFTSATEAITRQGKSGHVIRFLNAYIDAMVEAIFAEQGVLDKIMGDGLLVLFGAPDPSPNHALQAVRAAVRMAELVPQLNTQWPLCDARPLRVGIGIHSGSLMDGVIGRGRRVEYTIIGDAVNTASRVEDYTKEVLAQRIEHEGDDGQPTAIILISHSTYELVKQHIAVDGDIPPCQAKGKSEPIPVYRVLGLLDSETS